MALRVNIETIYKLPLAQKVTAMALVLLLILGGFVYYVYLPMHARLQTLSSALADLNKELSVNRARAAKLVELKALNATLQRRLTELRAQLPPEPEIPALLRQVSDLGQATGLTLAQWRPGSKRQSPSGLYIELPVSVESTVGYHALGNFLDRISRLPRIVNVISLRMGNAKEEDRRFAVNASFTVIAFAAVPEAGKGR